MLLHSRRAREKKMKESSFIVSSELLLLIFFAGLLFLSFFSSAKVSFLSSVMYKTHYIIHMADNKLFKTLIDRAPRVCHSRARIFSCYSGHQHIQKSLGLLQPPGGTSGILRQFLHAAGHVPAALPVFIRVVAWKYGASLAHISTLHRSVLMINLSRAVL